MEQTRFQQRIASYPTISCDFKGARVLGSVYHGRLIAAE